MVIKCNKGKVGQPKFQLGDTVGFYITPYQETEQVFCVGQVYIVDSYGTFEQNEEPSYDVMIDNFYGKGKRTLVKHIRESQLYYRETKND